MKDDIFQMLLDTTNAYLAGAKLKLFEEAPCGSITRDLERHMEQCEACKGGWSIFDGPESEERYLDDPRHGQAEELNRRR